MANQTAPSPQQWALAATAILTTMTRRAPRHDLLGGGSPQEPDAQSTAKTILQNSWGIESRQKLESTLEWLSTGGHSADYQSAATAFGQAQPQQRQADPKLAFVGQYGAQIGNRGLLAWDLGRLFAVAGWGYLAGFCSDVEAWGLILPAADRLRSAYTSWDEYGQHYRLGCLFWSAGAVAQVDHILGQLRSAPDSPWRVVPWKLDANPNVGAVPYGAAPVAGAVAPAPGAGAPVGASPYGAAPAGGYGAAPVPGAYGNVPVVAPPPGGAPAPYGVTPPVGAAPYGAAPPVGAYGGVPVVAPPPGGALPPPGLSPYGGAPGGPGAPYGGAPIIHPSPGGAGGLGGPAVAKKKTLLFVGLGVGGLLVFSLIGGLAWHFTHESRESHEHESRDKHHH